MDHTQLIRMQTMLEQALDQIALQDEARTLGFFRRLRDITPHRLAIALILTLATKSVESLADLQRGFVLATGVSISYKPFFKQLEKRAFAPFMQAVFTRLLNHLVLEVLVAREGTPLAQFDDILAHDSTEFKLPDCFREKFPGRYPVKAATVAALHTTLSLRRDQPLAVKLTSQREAATHQRPEPEALKNKLFIGDRAYADCVYVQEVASAGGACLVRATKRVNPKILAGWVGKQAWDGSQGQKFQAVLAQARGTHLDLDVEFPRSRRRQVVARVRLLALWNPVTQAHVLLFTNLARADFSAEFLGEVYRLRWQVELLFKEWKSYANLHAFSTTKESIATGLIWAALAAAFLKRFCAHATAQVFPRSPISTRKAAMALAGPLSELLGALIRGVGVRRKLQQLFAYLWTQARRANRKREWQTGRGRTGLWPRGAEPEAESNLAPPLTGSLAPLIA